MTEKKKALAGKTAIRYPKPKILCVDLPGTPEALKAAGYNVRGGTFGRPYKVEKSDGYTPIVGRPLLPNYAEQEIVIINLEPPETADGPEGEQATSPGELDWYAKASTGVIDPRPRVMTWI